MRVSYGVGVGADGTRRYLPHRVFGTGGINQVRRQLVKSIREQRVEVYAEFVAARVSARLDLQDVVRVEIVRGEFDIDDCFLEHRIEATEEVLAQADVVRLSEDHPASPAAPLVPGTDMVGMPL